MSYWRPAALVGGWTLQAASYGTAFFPATWGLTVPLFNAGVALQSAAMSPPNLLDIIA